MAGRRRRRTSRTPIWTWDKAFDKMCRHPDKNGEYILSSIQAQVPLVTKACAWSWSLHGTQLQWEICVREISRNALCPRLLGGRRQQFVAETPRL